MLTLEDSDRRAALGIRLRRLLEPEHGRGRAGHAATLTSTAPRAGVRYEKWMRPPLHASRGPAVGV
jgi:hypothetical protein